MTRSIRRSRWLFHRVSTDGSMGEAEAVMIPDRINRQPLEWTDPGVRFIDQSKLPTEEVYATCKNYEGVGRRSAKPDPGHR